MHGEVTLRRRAIAACAAVAALLVAAGFHACGGTVTPQASSGADSVSDATFDDASVQGEATSDTQHDSAVDSAVEADARADVVPDTGEYCPDPIYPPRTDGCPCNPEMAPCTKENAGKVCVYPSYCPSGGAARREECMWVEKDKVYEWVQGVAPCPGDPPWDSTPPSEGGPPG